MSISDSRYWQGIKKVIPFFFYEFLIDFIFKLRSINNRGIAFYCPICNKSHKKFINEKLCPRCNSSIRHRTIWTFLNRKTSLFTESGRKLLYFAPQFYIDKRFKKLNNIDYLSADLNAKRAMQRIDMTNIPYENEYFDYVISVDVLDDVIDDKKAMKELYRVQNKEGWSIHQVPVYNDLEETIEDSTITNPEERMKHFKAYENRRLYGKDYIERLKEVGFSVRVFDLNMFCSEEEIKKMALNDYKIYFLTK